MFCIRTTLVKRNVHSHTQGGTTRVDPVAGSLRRFSGHRTEPRMSNIPEIEGEVDSQPSKRDRMGGEEGSINAVTPSPSLLPTGAPFRHSETGFLENGGACLPWNVQDVRLRTISTNTRSNETDSS